jgi:hypothetical protein
MYPWLQSKKGLRPFSISDTLVSDEYVEQLVDSVTTNCQTQMKVVILIYIFFYLVDGKVL